MTLTSFLSVFSYAALNTSMLTKAVPAPLRGTALSMDMSLGSGVRMVSPGVGAWMLATWGPASIGSVAAALVALLLGLIHVKAIECVDVGDTAGTERGVGGAAGATAAAYAVATAGSRDDGKGSDGLIEKKKDR